MKQVAWLKVQHVLNFMTWKREKKLMDKMNMIWKRLGIKSSSKLMIMNFVQVFCELCVLHSIYIKFWRDFLFLLYFQINSTLIFIWNAFISVWLCMVSSTHGAGFVSTSFFLCLKCGKWTWKRKSFCMWWMRIVNDYNLLLWYDHCRMEVYVLSL